MATQADALARLALLDDLAPTWRVVLWSIPGLLIMLGIGVVAIILVRQIRRFRRRVDDLEQRVSELEDQPTPTTPGR